MLRLLLLLTSQQGFSSSVQGTWAISPYCRHESPFNDSTLMTSAPQSASIRAAAGTAA